MVRVALLALLSLSLVSATKMNVLNPPNPSNSNTDIAVLWVQGAFCEPQSYTDIATEFQKQMGPMGYNPWVVISDFTFDTPNPVTFGWMHSDALAAVQKAGFTGDNFFVAAHSLGGVMT